MHSVHLDKLRFFAYHGLHEEEAIAGAEFEVNLSIDFKQDDPIKKISDTINYVDVYELIKLVFQEPVHLMETLAEEITKRIGLLDNRVSAVNIRITKLNPPIPNFSGNVSVSFSKSF